MKPGPVFPIIIAAIAIAFLTGCVTHRTVTRGGKTVQSGYVMKRPIRDAMRNSD